jgi:hypothetical protein
MKLSTPTLLCLVALISLTNSSFTQGKFKQEENKQHLMAVSEQSALISSTQHNYLVAGLSVKKPPQTNLVAGLSVKKPPQINLVAGLSVKKPPQTNLVAGLSVKKPPYAWS